MARATVAENVQAAAVARRRGPALWRLVPLAFYILAFTLVGSLGFPPPKDGSTKEEPDQPMRARKRSSDRMAIALTRRIDTGIDRGLVDE